MKYARGINFIVMMVLLVVKCFVVTIQSVLIFLICWNAKHALSLARSLSLSLSLLGKVHGSLARAGKVRGQTPKVRGGAQKIVSS